MSNTTNTDNERYFAMRFIALNKTRDEVFKLCSDAGFKLRRSDNQKVVKVYVSRILAIMHENEGNQNVPTY